MIRNIVFNEIGSKLSFTDSGGFLKVMSVSDHQIVSVKAHNGHAISVAFSPNNEYIATGGQDNVICIWKLNEDSLKKEFEIRGHTDDVTCLLFDHQKHLYSASRDCSIKIWNLNGLY
jgi:WD40 repeat protein